MLDLTVKIGDVQIKRQITLQYAVQMHMQLVISYSILVIVAIILSPLLSGTSKSSGGQLGITYVLQVRWLEVQPLQLYCQIKSLEPFS